MSTHFWPVTESRSQRHLRSPIVSSRIPRSLLEDSRTISAGPCSYSSISCYSHNSGLNDKQLWPSRRKVLKWLLPFEPGDKAHLKEEHRDSIQPRRPHLLSLNLQCLLCTRIKTRDAFDNFLDFIWLIFKNCDLSLFSPRKYASWTRKHFQFGFSGTIWTRQHSQFGFSGTMLVINQSDDHWSWKCMSSCSGSHSSMCLFTKQISVNRAKRVDLLYDTNHDGYGFCMDLVLYDLRGKSRKCNSFPKFTS